MPINKKILKGPKPVRITDTTFRDGHQSIFATRMRIEDMLPIAEKMDKVGFHSVEVWGGATFDVCTRYLNEDPWERLVELKKRFKRTPLQMLVRGQNLVGYRNYADDVVESFIKQAADAGIDIFRVFDALNDERNFESCFKAIKRSKKHIQAALSYSLTEPRLGGRIFNLKYFVEKAKTFRSMGADSICIKDMAGLLNPYDAYDLVSALKSAVSIPVHIHSHYTSGMASMTYLKAIEAGVDVIDCALAPFGLRSSEPASEPIVAALKDTPRDTGINLDRLFELNEFLETVAPKYRQFMDNTKMAVIDTGVLEHQIPGGMISNLVSQLREADALGRINEVYEEIPRTRKELGFPPLVTPTSQIVGIQAVQNVLFGRYKMISSQVKDYAYGLYGKPPVPMDTKVQRLALKGYPRGEKPITCRAADILEPEMKKAREAVKELAKDERDVLIYALYPTTGLRFLKWKYGLEEAPAETKAKTIEEVKREDELIEKALKGLLMERAPSGTERGPGTRAFNVFVGGEHYSIEVEEVGGRPRVRAVGETQPIITKEQTETKENGKKENGASPAASASAGSSPSAASAPAQAAAAASAAKNNAKAAPNDRAAKSERAEKAEKGDAAASNGEYSITAPMPGMLVQYSVGEGDMVKEGDVLVILEAMKMQNNLTSKVSGVVRSLKVTPGTSVEKDQVLLTIAR